MLVKCSEELDSLADSSSSDISEIILGIKKSLEITQKNLKNALSKSFKITNDLKSVNSELENFALEKVFDDNDQMGQFDLENLEDIRNITDSLIQKKKEFLKRNLQTKNTSVLSMQKIVEMLSKNISVFFALHPTKLYFLKYIFHVVDILTFIDQKKITRMTEQALFDVLIKRSITKLKVDTDTMIDLAFYIRKFQLCSYYQIPEMKAQSVGYRSKKNLKINSSIWLIQ